MIITVLKYKFIQRWQKLIIQDLTPLTVFLACLRYRLSPLPPSVVKTPPIASEAWRVESHTRAFIYTTGKPCQLRPIKNFLGILWCCPEDHPGERDGTRVTSGMVAVRLLNGFSLCQKRAWFKTSTYYSAQWDDAVSWWLWIEMCTVKKRYCASSLVQEGAR